jgi:hypothetical protein
MEHTTEKPNTFESESSIIAHPYKYPQDAQSKLPTWSLIVILIVAFFILKSFIYLKDDKRHGK